MFFHSLPLHNKFGDLVGIRFFEWGKYVVCMLHNVVCCTRLQIFYNYVAQCCKHVAQSCRHAVQCCKRPANILYNVVNMIKKNLFTS